MNSLDDLKETQNRWASLVGHFILSFGVIELNSFALWRKYFPQQSSPDRFKSRVEKILHHLRRGSAADQGLADLLVEALKLADRRNTIAHHPSCLQVHEIAGTERFYMEWALKSELGTHYITEECLRQLVESVSMLSKEIQLALMPKIP